MVRRHVWLGIVCGWLCWGMGAPAVARIPWETDLAAALQKAGQSQRLVLLHFWDDNCLPCAKMEQNVFRNSEVGRVLSLHYVPVKIHVRQHPELKEKYGIRAWPTDVVLSPSGRELYRGIPRPDPRHFLATLSNVAVHARTQRPVQRSDAHSNWDPPKAAPQAVRNSKFSPPGGSATAAGGTAQVVQNRFAGPPAGSPSPADHAHRGQAGHQMAPTAGPYAQQLVDPRGRPSGVPGPATGPVPPTSRSHSPSNGTATATPPSATGASRFSTNRPPVPTVNRFAAPASSRDFTAPPAAGSGPVGPPPPSGPATAAQSPPDSQLPGRVFDPLAAQGTQPSAPTRSQIPPASSRPSTRPQPPTPPRGTAGHPPIGLDGYCPVTLVNREQWKKGDAQYGAIHRGRTYLFVSRAAQQAFLSNPDRYAPMLSELDVVQLIDHGRHVVGHRRHGVFHRNRIYVFADEMSLAKFFENPDRYHQKAVELLSRSR